MDDAQLKRRAWAGMVEFQRLIGRHAPAGGVLETDSFVASSVPGIPSSLMNAATPVDGSALAPHLDEIERFYAATPKWGAWIDPSSTEDVAALAGRGLVLDSNPVLMAAELDAIDAPDDDARVERVEMHDVGAVNDAAYGYPKPVLAPTLGTFPAGELHPYGIRAPGRARVRRAPDRRGHRRLRDHGRHPPAPPRQAPRLEAPRAGPARGEATKA